MAKNLEHTSGFYLIFRLIFIFYIIFPIYGQDSTKLFVEKDSTFYPGKPLIMSLLVPGLGQLYNKEPIWKPGLFIGTEIVTLSSILYSNKKADQIRLDYQEFADNNWSIENWYSFTQSGPEVKENNGLYFTDNKLKAMRSYIGTHHLTIHLKGDLVNIFNTEFLSSDSLSLIAGYLGSENISMVKDRHYYENIGKYDQFVGGWSDVSTDWYWEEKDVGDSIEIVIKTPNKQNYLDERYKANQWLSFAKFSISAMMFNHVVSGLEAVWANRNKDSEIIKEEKKLDLDLGLFFDGNNAFGVGGLSLRMNF
ncbi:MAG: hypothetical protein CBD44_01795 [Flavobacteriaceae bacterium TMED184]|nr:MAG: hypothetical protein CBD44_01795 [Flavobacteriaceae bacterium TMED184]